MKIGVFDSGRGGEAVARKLSSLLPTARVITAHDHKNVPYGGKTPEEIIRLTSAAIQPLIAAHCDTIVLACNTATVNAIEALRKQFPLQRFVGLEPMVKPAVAASKSKKIAVLATPATLASANYKHLKTLYASDTTLYEPDCSSWAKLIEDGEQTQIDLAATITPLVEKGVDTIVLACTHYHWLEGAIQDLAGDSVTVLEPTDAVKARVLEITGPR